MNTKTKRHIAAWMLLAVFVPMLILSSVHVHGSSNVLVKVTGSAASLCEECDGCVQHHCQGHLGQHTVSMHDCVLCQFLTLPMLAVAAATLIFFSYAGETSYAGRQLSLGLDVCGIPTLRAPPAA